MKTDKLFFLSIFDGMVRTLAEPLQAGRRRAIRQLLE